VVQRIGFTLIVLGCLIPLGYVLKAFFTFQPIPLPFRIAIAAVILGIILILASVGWERYKAVKKGEGFKGEEK